MVVWHLNSCIFCCQVSAWVMFDDLVRSANQSCCWNSCSPGASGSVNIDAFFFQICYQSAIDSEWKCVHLWMALSTIKTTAFRSCSAAFWHNSQHIRAERETYVKKIPWNPFEIQDWRTRRKNWSEMIVLMIWHRRRRVSLGRFPISPIRNGACFHMLVRVPSKAYHHSNYSSEGDEHCQHSISWAVNKLCWGVLMMSVWETK